jgi:signal transduction histidine kinase
MGKLLWDLLDSESYDPSFSHRINILRRGFDGIAALEKQEQRRLAELRAAGVAFTQTARQLNSAVPAARERLARTLEQHYDQFTSLATQVVRAQAAGSADLERQIQIQSGELGSESLWLLGACLALSLIGAIATITVTARSFRTMRWQSEELSRVSWHLLESQEVTARRFSHEMHDELGQSLAGVKALVRGMSGGDGRREDCLMLLDEAIRNVRELSQLLRPVVLDDFGLDAALHWLAERFEERTRIHVTYVSNLSNRLPEQTETHLFRIAQEALTNVARHSGATASRICIDEDISRVTLQIEDNGKGLFKQNTSSGPSLGMVGMRARARQLGGELGVQKGEQGGVRITVWAPLKPRDFDADKENAHSTRG